MKKAIGTIALLAVSAGIWALPAAARGRENWDARANSAAYCGHRDVHHGGRDWRNGRDWR